MADGELFAAMHDVGLAEFVAKGLDKKHRKPLAPRYLRTTSTTFSSCAGRLASLGESRHTAFFLACERGITNID